MMWNEYYEPDVYDDEESFSSSYLTLKYHHIERETEKAWLIVFDIRKSGTPVSDWIPKSQGSLNPEEKTVEVKEWLVDQKGLRVYEY